MGCPPCSHEASQTVSNKCCGSICICKMQIRGALFRLQRLLQASLHFAAAPPLNRILGESGPSPSQRPQAPPSPAPPPRAHPSPLRRLPASLLHPPLRRPGTQLRRPGTQLCRPLAYSCVPEPSPPRLLRPCVEASCSAEELHDGGRPRRWVSYGRGGVPRLLPRTARAAASSRPRTATRTSSASTSAWRNTAAQPSSASASAWQGGAGGRGGAREDGGGSRRLAVLMPTPLGGARFGRRRSIR
jgi:hypothetical protein